jgi:protein-disulfide isomerase
MRTRLFIGAVGAIVLFACAKKAESAAAASAAPATAAAAAKPKPAFGPDSMPMTIDTALLKAADLGRIAGDSAAKVILIEISDFQCPYCKTFHDSTYAPLRREYIDNGKARMAYVNLPLRIHPNAWPAAEAAMCSSVQNTFWAMHDSIFNAQQRWESIARPDTMFARFAQSLRLDMPKYTSCTTGHATRPLIQSDAERANSAGITGTPMFLVGDSSIAGAYPIARFRQVLNANLAAPSRR